MGIVVRFVPADRNSPPAKLADAELLFEEGQLRGLKLIGFQVWARPKWVRRPGPERHVTFPAGNWPTNGEDRTVVLLCPISDIQSRENVRELILDAYREFEEQATHQVGR